MRALNSIFASQFWVIRLINTLAVSAGLILLIADSPVFPRLPGPYTRPVIEAMPLLLVAASFFTWLAIERPAVLDFIKQAFIALAFLLWGIDLLLPVGKTATFIGAVVIAIYVFDLAWLIEGNLRKKLYIDLAPAGSDCISPECKPGGSCGCQSRR